MAYAKEGEKETSCGAVVINNKKILFVKHGKFKFWNIPKGHIEDGETDVECALREVEEETGIADLKVLPGFKKQTTYTNRLFKTIKTVVLFIFLSKTDKVDIHPGENDDYKWLSVKEAVPIIEKISAKDIMMEAIEFAKEKDLL